MSWTLGVLVMICASAPVVGAQTLPSPGAAISRWEADFSGIWHTAGLIPCNPDLNRFLPCGLEIGGSPLALDLGTDMPGGLPYQPRAAAVAKKRKADLGVDDPHGGDPSVRIPAERPKAAVAAPRIENS